MSSPILKIDNIKNIAVYKNFQWSNSVRDEGNNVAEFKNINVIYGRNYSGKTTLSRIIRSAEIGLLSDKYVTPEFKFSLADGSEITQRSLTTHSHVIRVFNEDFVRDNLRFITDDEQTINSFAILGEDNTRLEEEIETNENELGSVEDKDGLIGKSLEANEKHSRAENAHNRKLNALEDKLRDKANKSGSGIKHNKVFGNANYNLTKIKSDIQKVIEDSFFPITDEDVVMKLSLLKETPKEEIRESSLFSLKYSSILSKSKELVEKKIQASAPIQELLNDSVLAAWVRSGREQHENKREQCGFCGNDLPPELWDKLDKHFNQESENLLSALSGLLATIQKEKARLPNLLKINNSDFYSNFHEDLDILKEELSKCTESYLATIELIEVQVKSRMEDIFKDIIFEEPTSVETELNNIRLSFEEYRNKANQSTSSLSSEQVKARDALRLHEVFTFINDIAYVDETKAIEKLKENQATAARMKLVANAEVSAKRKKIGELKDQLKDESKGADQVNEYLNDFFGHQSLSLKPIEETSPLFRTVYRFEVTRNEQKAYHLSEGECSLIAFCYFMAKLKDIETKGNQPIIWIDDPISSLDANHIFFVYSLINAEIVTPEAYDDAGEIKERNRFEQLFISTHNLDFLKYLKRLPGASSKRKSQYFIINRTDQTSDISLMPKYLKEYVTEFNFLFHQIHKCAAITAINDDNYTTFYNFGNNARKFFEIYLYYKYPDQGMTQTTLKTFFGEESVPAILSDRINNEYSHLAGVFERGSTPIEVPEMHTAAKFILDKIKQNDHEQYISLVQSVGEVSA
ncbi:MAG: AAA family ATPase [Paraglaciecola sp.]|uniref:AAA family ATPase n=1 Tax=Paraglaciecola sp. TaxID=1920173 RepID=UPI003296BE5D